MTTKNYKCDACGNEGPWEKGWSTYGSMLLLEETGKYLATCSAECKESMDVEAAWNKKYGETYSQSEAGIRI